VILVAADENTYSLRRPAFDRDQICCARASIGA
jgi:hypothetical protein